MNDDGITDGPDIIRFMNAIFNNPGGLANVCRADFNGNGVVDVPDVPGMVAVLTTCAGVNCPQCPSPPDGDLNADGMTDGTDIARFINAVLNNPGGLANVCRADFNGNGAVDPPDVPPCVRVGKAGSAWRGPLSFPAPCFGPGFPLHWAPETL